MLFLFPELWPYSIKKKRQTNATKTRENVSLLCAPEAPEHCVHSGPETVVAEKREHSQEHEWLFYSSLTMWVNSAPDFCGVHFPLWYHPGEWRGDDWSFHFSFLRPSWRRVSTHSRCWTVSAFLSCLRQIIFCKCTVTSVLYSVYSIDSKELLIIEFLLWQCVRACWCVSSKRKILERIRIAFWRYHSLK